MKTLRHTRILCIWTTVFTNCCFGHLEPVHKALTTQAAASSTGLSDSLRNYFGLSLVSLPELQITSIGKHNPLEWIKIGSNDEDGGVNGTYPIGKLAEGQRVQNHFYRSDTGAGLTDGFQVWPENSFRWATVRDINAGGIIEQKYSWQNARDYLINALTNSSKATRDEQLAKTLYALGHVVHLNQDLTQPEHSRNDAHPPLGLISYLLPDPAITAAEKFMEDHGLTYLKRAIKEQSFESLFPRSTKTWTSWKAGGFVRIKDFWDRDKYGGNAGDSSALVFDAGAASGAASLAGERLGLGEFVNGNFVTKDASYAEFTFSRDYAKHYFAYPSLESSTTFPTLRQTIGASLDQVDFVDGASGTVSTVRKLFDGTRITPHSKLTHNGIMFRELKRLTVATTVSDEAVLDKYYAILMPKAIEYSAGILEYFFRGQLETTVTGNGNGTYNLAIKNKSGQSFKGGSFKLFYDQTSGTRTELSGSGFQLSWSSSTTLADNASINATVTPPSDVVLTNYILVYKGTVGIDGSQNKLDPVDENIAIAAKTFLPPLWWKMEESSGDRFDAVQGVPLHPTGVTFGGVTPRSSITSGTGRMGTAAQFNSPGEFGSTGGPFSLQTDFIPQLALLTNEGFTVVGWFNITSGPLDAENDNPRLSPIVVDWGAYVALDLETFPDFSISFNAANEDFSEFDDVEISFTPSLNQWVFYRLWYDPSSKRFGAQLDNGTKHFTDPIALSDSTAGRIFMQYYTGSAPPDPEAPGTCRFDEVGYFQRVLSDAEVTHIHNSGSGRTWPVVFP